MRRPNKQTYCLIPVLAVLLIAVNLAPELVARVSAQADAQSWSYTGSLNANRYGHTATLLRNGKILVVGGGGWPCSGRICYSAVNSSAELYDPATGKWSYTGSLNRRTDHTATLLPNGEVLVAGGINFGYDIGYSSYVNTAELYDPATERWRPTGSFITIRDYNSAVLLPNGKVLAVGSPDFNARPGVFSAELYDPATGQWSSTSAPTMFGSLTLLPNGKVVLFTATYTAELYDPETERWSSTSKSNVIQYLRRATLLANGKVLVIGGRDGTNTVLAELYDPATGTWSVTGNPQTTHYTGRMTLLPDGGVLLDGGYDSNSLSQRTAELYNPASGTWSPASSLITPRKGHTATLLPGGKVLVTGGFDGDEDDGTVYLTSTELFDVGLPQAGTVASVSAANYSPLGLASEAIASAFGTGLATTTDAATALPLPTQLAATTVKVKDAKGMERLAPLFFVSPTRVNYQIPPGTAAGAATITITNSSGAVSTGVALIRAVAPSLFAANSDGQGVAAALALRVRADGSQSYEPVAQFDAAQNKFVTRPLDLGPESDQVYLLLFGTGIRSRSSLSAVIATIGGAYSAVSFAGMHSDFEGLDQVNVLVPRSLMGRGELDVLLMVEAQMANPVRIHIK